MQLQIYTLLRLCILFYNQYSLVNAKALIGHNIRLANPNEFPSVVTLIRCLGATIVVDRDVICGGVLVTKKDVLTAEHCLLNDPIGRILITAGSNNILQASRFYPIWWISFDQWCTQINKPIRDAFNDIAIIRLNTEVGNEVPVAIISPIPPNQLYGLRVDVLGWGTLNNGSISSKLQTVSLRVLDRDECSQIISALASETIPIEKRQLCTVGNPYALIRDGDSGSPLFYEGAVVGINTGTCPFPEDYVHPSKVNIHFAVSYYKSFIHFIINI